VDHVLAAKMAHRHVLLLRAEVPDLLDGDQPELVADSRRDMPARPGYRLPRQLVEERRADARRVRERSLVRPAADRFQQIAHGPGLECLDRVLIVRRREDHGRRDLEAAEMPRGLDAAHARHLDVEQHDLRLEPRRLLDRLGARCACARDAPALELADEPLEALARRRLVVDDQHFSDSVHVSSGNLTVTWNRPASRTVSTDPRSPYASRTRSRRLSRACRWPGRAAASGSTGFERVITSCPPST